ncbi:MAG TPA: hypothetical protein VGS02_05650 [Acidobacteriaceae bacterium]|nr:hypothetical protein [Acidobacteriaceae bacterium]
MAGIFLEGDGSKRLARWLNPRSDWSGAFEHRDPSTAACGDEIVRDGLAG